jgi:hypothetical protein
MAVYISAPKTSEWSYQNREQANSIADTKKIPNNQKISENQTV